MAQQHHRIILNVLGDDALYQGASVPSSAGLGLDINQPKTRRGLVRVPAFGAHDRDRMLINFEDRPTCSDFFEQVGVRQVIGRHVTEFMGLAREQIGQLRVCPGAKIAQVAYADFWLAKRILSAFINAPSVREFRAHGRHDGV